MPARPGGTPRVPRADEAASEEIILPSAVELGPADQGGARESGGFSPALVLPAAQLPTPAGPGLSLGEDHPPQMITLVLRPSGEAQRDIRRIGRLHGTFISYPGKDRFQFQIFENGRGHLIDFPNDTTRLCPELIEKLRLAIGEENIRIEPILYL